MRVSHIVPTYGRPGYHAPLYATFVGQTAPDKELLLLDDSPTPSRFFMGLRDPRVHYLWTPNRLSIGQKRNALVAQSTGSIIVQTDDDDQYAPPYAETMASRLGRAALTKLSVWRARTPDGAIWRWDTRDAGPMNYAVSGARAPTILAPGSPSSSAAVDSALWGYGFSYVYPREVALAYPFPDANIGEDLAFVGALRAAGLLVTHQADLEHLCLHAMHPQSTSQIYPQECVAFCRTCATTTEDDGPTTTGITTSTRVPSHITLIPGRVYNAVALVKASHKVPGLIARAKGYGLQVLGVTDNAPTPRGAPAPKRGYRYIAVRAKARVARTIDSRVPVPFSWADKTRIVQLT